MRTVLFFACLIIAAQVSAQKDNVVLAGPMLGHTELRTAEVWLQFNAKITSAILKYRKKEDKKTASLNIVTYTNSNHKEFNTAKFTLTGLEPATTYEYEIANSNTAKAFASGEVTTQALWQWRSPAPDFSFITGSCAYFNEPVYDRPGKPYGQDSSIFETMAKEKADFMLWLGDNWYTREADYNSEWGLYYRASRDRSLPVLQKFLKAMPHYAIWDDHDYGPNDADKSYILKEAARNVFMDYWCNPSYGENNQGTYTKLTCNDVDVFMLDDRWFRNNDKMMDSIKGQPNPGKEMFGKQQMEWLKNALLLSNGNNNISFRIIATGSQVLNPLSPYDCFRHYPAEYNELMQFIAGNNINGVLFLTGDRHHSEIIKAERQDNYTLYDITSSPLTSHVAKTSGREINNPYRVGNETDAQNFTRFSFSGKGANRKITVQFIGIKGEQLSEWSTTLASLSNH